MKEIKTKIKFDSETIDSANLCNLFDSEDLQTIGNLVWDGFVKDKQSRGKWEERMNAAMDLAMQIQSAKNFPWPNCSNIIFPLVSIAALQFSTRSYSNLIQGTEVVKFRLVGGDNSPQLAQQARLIGSHMSWQVLEEDEGWEEQHDRLFINVAIVGCNFIKTRYSPIERHNVSELVMAKDLVLDYFAKSVESCRRKTQIIQLDRNAIWSRCKQVDSKGTTVYRKEILDEAWFKSDAMHFAVPDNNQTEHDARVGLAFVQGDQDTPFEGLEQHRWLDLDGDGYAEPYIVTIEASSKTVLRIVARVERDEDVERDSDGGIISIKPMEYFTKYGFIPAPDGGIYDMGFGVLLGPLNETVNTAINQIFDAGTANMLGGGFAASGAKLKSGVYTRTPGEWKIVKGASEDIRKALISFPEIPISNVLFQLLSLIIQYSDRLAGTVGPTTGENPGQNTPAQTYQGMIEQGTQIYRSIFKRIWRSMKEEFSKLHQLNARFLPERQRFGSKNQYVTREMYKTDSRQVVPVANPSLVSDQQRIMQAGEIRKGAYSVPGYNVEEVERKWLRALGADDIDQIYPGGYSDFAKKHPLPNPKLQAEQAKLESKAAELKYKQWETITNLRSQQSKLQAEIDLLQSEAAKNISAIGGDKAAHQLATFDTVMTHLKDMMKMLGERADSMQKAAQQDEGEENEADSGGAGRSQADSGGQGAVETSSANAEGAS